MAAVVTDLEEWMAELGHQIAKAGQCNNWSSAPNSPWGREAIEGDTIVAVPSAAQIPIMV